MNTGYTIEKADLSRLGRIMEIENACFAEDSFSRRQMAYLISKAKGIFYVICRNNTVAAYISLISRSGSPNLRIYSVAVHPDERGAGLGQALIEKSTEYALSNELKSITLEVNTLNKAAISLYEKNGFKTISVIYGYYRNGDALRMKKEL